MRLNKSDYVDVMADAVRDGQYSVEAARTILEEAGVKVTCPVEMRLLSAEAQYLDRLVTV